MFWRVVFIALIVVFALPLPARAVEDGLVGYWKLDEITTVDESWQPSGGQIDGALLFDGVKQRVKLGDISDLDFSQENALTIAAWVYPTGMDTGSRVVMARGTTHNNYANSAYSLGLYNFDPTRWYLGISYGTGGVNILTDAGTADIDAWQHVAMTWDGTTLRLYKNAVEIATNTSPASIWDGDEAVDRLTAIGAAGRVEAGYWRGKIDEVRAYNRALTPAEITDLYNNNSPTATGLVGNWKLDEASGLTAADSSGQGNDGTLDTAGLTLDAAGSNDGFVPAGVTIVTPSGIHGNGVHSAGNAEERISLGQDASLHSYDAITLSAWINPESIAGNYYTIFDDVSGVDLRIGSWTRSKAMQFYLGRGNNITWVTDADTIQTDVWQHVAVTFDFTVPSSQPQFYVNAQPVSTPDSWAWASVTASSGPVSIANRKETGLPFHGRLDDLRVYNRALSAEEIAEIYNADCVGPDSEEAVIIYNKDQGIPQYCNGREWVKMADLNPAAGGPGCTNPDAVEGVLIYNQDVHMMTYCDGDDWIALGLTGGYGNGCPVGGHGSGYFVITSEAYTGDLEQEAIDRGLSPSNGYDAANKLCLNDLTNNDWMGKADAQARGLLQSTKIKAFIQSLGNHALPNTEYFFAASGDDTKGGASFTTDENGFGPGDSANWSDVNRFGGDFIYFTTLPDTAGIRR